MKVTLDLSRSDVVQLRIAVLQRTSQLRRLQEVIPHKEEHRRRTSRITQLEKLCKQLSELALKMKAAQELEYQFQRRLG